MEPRGPLASFPSESDHHAEARRVKIDGKPALDPLAAFLPETPIVRPAPMRTSAQPPSRIAVPRQPDTRSAVLPFTATSKRRTSMRTMVAAAGCLGVATAILPFASFMGRATSTSAAPVRSAREAPSPPLTPLEPPAAPVADNREEPQPVGTSGIAAPAIAVPAIAVPATQAAAKARTSNRAQGAKRVAPGRQFKGNLFIDSRPRGATVHINQARVGVTPLRLNGYPAGSHAVWVQRDGYDRWSAAVRVPANRSTRINASLTRTRER